MGTEDRGFVQHDGGALQSMPMLFTFSPLSKEGRIQSNGEGHFHQAGGHDGVFQSKGKVLEKKVDRRELDFYKLANAVHRMKPSLISEVEAVIAACVQQRRNGTGTEALHVYDTTNEKLLNILFKTRVRLEGLTIFRALEHTKVKTSKVQSHAISAAMGVNLQDILTFFLTDESGVRRDIAMRFEAQLHRILHHFELVNNSFLFIGSSILLIYDNDNKSPWSRWARALENATKLRPDTYAALRRKTKVDVRMIDFAHTAPLPSSMDRDEGYITGLKSIISALQAIQSAGSTPQQPIFSLSAAATDAIGASNPHVPFGKSYSHGHGYTRPTQAAPALIPSTGRPETTFETLLGIPPYSAHSEPLHKHSHSVPEASAPTHHTSTLATATNYASFHRLPSSLPEDTSNHSGAHMESLPPAPPDPTYSAPVSVSASIPKPHRKPAPKPVENPLQKPASPAGIPFFPYGNAASTPAPAGPITPKIPYDIGPPPPNYPFAQRAPVESPYPPLAPQRCPRIGSSKPRARDLSRTAHFSSSQNSSRGSFNSEHSYSRNISVASRDSSQPCDFPNSTQAPSLDESLPLV